MSIWEILGAILIGPLKLIFEVIFSVAYRVLMHPGLATVVLSLVINILVLPLYRRADAIQEAARDTENRLRSGVQHIKATFTGDERMMLLQAYYRQQGYSPLSSLNGSVSLLLEIPFFIAAYQFLSGLDIFTGVSFGPISDLSAPDGLLALGSLHINVLPILMTLINVISSAIYLKGFPLKTKLQLYGMAGFFLVFLYNSPAALVFYWTLNNAFSLVKTLFYRLRDPRRVRNVSLAMLGIASFIAGILISGIWRSTFLIGLGIGMQLPWLVPFFRSKLPLPQHHPCETKPNTRLFILGCLFMALLVGLLIPSTYISASVEEYIEPQCFYNPIWFVVQSLCMGIGTFLLWLGVFYWLAGPGLRNLFCRGVWIAAVGMLVNYMFFGTGLGVISPDLQYTEGFLFEKWELIVNTVVIVILAIAALALYRRFSKLITTVLLVGAIAIGCMGVIHMTTITSQTTQVKERIDSTSSRMPEFQLSKNGKNVVVFMLDRAIGPYLPYILEENPTLKQQLDGFTYYEQTLSYGPTTNFGVPALYGGYEYTPENMNLRDKESLVDKHNEALKVMPAIFSQEGFAATTIDPSYAGYRWIPDLSIFDDLEGVEAYHADGKYDFFFGRMRSIGTRKRNFFVFSLMKTMPLVLQDPIYNNGAYRAVPTQGEDDTSGVIPTYMSAYYVLKNLDAMVTVTNGEENNFVMLQSVATHEPVILQEPDFEPLTNVDNSAYYPPRGKVHLQRRGHPAAKH